MRIMIFGKPGSGKSTFATVLGRTLAIPVYYLDRYFYIHNWIERDYTEFLQIQQDLVNRDKWIIDGNATKSFEIRYAQTDIAIYFCYSRITCLWRIFKRRFLVSKDHCIDDHAQGCKETMRWCLIKYLWTFENRVADKIAQLRAKYPHVKFYCVHNDSELQALDIFLRQALHNPLKDAS